MIRAKAPTTSVSGAARSAASVAVRRAQATPSTRGVSIRSTVKAASYTKAASLTSSSRKPVTTTSSRSLRSFSTRSRYSGVAPTSATKNHTTQTKNLITFSDLSFSQGSPFAEILSSSNNSAHNSTVYTSRRYASDLPSHTPLSMPALSPSMEKGNIASWSKKEGDKVKAGDVIAEIETDKATVAWECQEEGFIAKILSPKGTSDVPVGQTVAILVENKDDVAAFKDFKEGGEAKKPAAKEEKKETKKEEKAPSKPAAKPAAKKEEKPAAGASKQAATQPKSAAAPPKPQAQQSQQKQPQQQEQSSSRTFASPLAKKLATEKGFDVSEVAGSGPRGRVVKDDVLGYTPSQAGQSAPQQFAAQPQQAQPGAAYTDLPNSNIRKVTASRLTLSKQTIPHYYLTIDCKVDELIKLRTQLNGYNATSKDGPKLSLNDFIVKASAIALNKVPQANSSWADDAIRRYHTVDINVAVNTDQGLFTPLIKNADKIGLNSISSQVKAFAEKAKANKLSPADMQPGTFTISNLGMFGIKHFAAVINPPQACILAVGGTDKRVIPNETVSLSLASTGPATSTQQFIIGNYMSVTLSCDHRVVDGAIGAQWLNAFRELLEDPVKMLL